MFRLRLLPFFLLLCFAPSALAQTDCPAIVSAALEAVDTACNGTGRNQLCYGNITLDVTPHETVTDFHFEQPGDVVNIADVENLRLSSFSLDEAAWGVALMNMQAYLPGTLPGQNVTFLLFGDVAIEDRGIPVVEVPVTATNDVNVRLRPTTETRVIASLRAAEEAIASGRLPDNSWIRVSLDDGVMGWVSGDFLNGDVSQLMAVDSETTIFGPMQAFYFTTGINDAPCAEAPDSGILIQTPQGVGTVQLNANGVHIELGSTVYLQAVPGDAMTISVIDGHATLTAFDESQVVPAGTSARVPLDADGLASGAPEYPIPYAFQSLRLLPVNVAAFTPVTVGRAVATRDIPAAIAAVSSGGQGDTVVNAPQGGGTAPGGQSPAAGNAPRSGGWTITVTITQNTCDPSTMPAGSVQVSNPTVIFSADLAVMTWDFGDVQQNYFRVADNVYVANNPFGIPHATQTVTLTSATTFTVAWRATGGDNPCVFWHDGTGVFGG